VLLLGLVLLLLLLVVAAVTVVEGDSSDRILCCDSGSNVQFHGEFYKHLYQTFSSLLYPSKRSFYYADEIVNTFLEKVQLTIGDTG
jgi:hypothetical protein